MANFRLFKGRAAPDPSTPEPQAAAPTVDSLAKSMCDRKAIHWAMASAKLAGPPAGGGDHAAMSAVQAWLDKPGPQTQAAAAKAAMAAGHQSPAAWAAQAAAWASKGAGAVPLKLPAGAGGGATVDPGSLVSLAVSGSVALSAAIKAGAKLPTPKAAAAAVAPPPPTAPKPPTLPTAPPTPKLTIPTVPTMPKMAPAAVPSLPTPAELAAKAEAHAPFIKLGQQIAADPSIKC